MNRFKINEKGFWETNSSVGYIHDKTLCLSMINFFRLKEIKEVLDLGCGMGNYVLEFVSNNINCDGYDGNPNTPELTNGLVKVLDFSVPFDLKKTYDYIISEIQKRGFSYDEVFSNELRNSSSLSWFRNTIMVFIKSLE